MINKFLNCNKSLHKGHNFCLQWLAIPKDNHAWKSFQLSKIPDVVNKQTYLREYLHINFCCFFLYFIHYQLYCCWFCRGILLQPWKSSSTVPLSNKHDTAGGTLSSSLHKHLWNEQNTSTIYAGYKSSWICE